MSKPSKKLRKEAHNLCRLADKVIAYRRDVIAAEAIGTIEGLRDHLQQQLRNKDKPATAEALKKSMGKLDAAMRPHGGDIYPVTFISENVEMILVAAILAIGIRTFFLQPFKIPTNSMYPTYAGMTDTVYNIDEAGPNALERTWNFVTLGAVNYAQPAPVAGEVLIPIGIGSDDSGAQAVGKGIIPSEEFMGRKWFGLLPAPKRHYTLYVGGEPVKFEVPLDFRLDDVILKTYFPDFDSLYEVFVAYQQDGKIARSQRGVQAISTGKNLQVGQSVLDFDIDTGDMLFVDRFSYNFVPPDVGDPVVFRTQKVTGLVDSRTGDPTEQYYIKRLVGVAGDTLEVKEPVLYRNGEPIEGAGAFQKNADQADGYAGYKAAWALRPGKTDTVPEAHVYVMGDNSPQSFDSRGWGTVLQQKNPRFAAELENLNFVPEKEVIGEAFFIFYPFSKRWGPAE